MCIRDSIEDLPFFKAGDNTILTEVFHPKNDAVDLPYSLAYAKIEAKQKSLKHVLKNEELYIFIKGHGTIHINGKSNIVQQGSVVLVPKGKEQYVENSCDETLCFYCIVSPPWSEDQEEILK